MNRTRLALVVGGWALLISATAAQAAVRPRMPIIFQAHHAAGSASGHIFVSGDQLTGQEGFNNHLARYPLTNGQPAATPDLTFPTKTSGPVAVDSAGNVYAATYCNTVNVYPPDSTTPTRSLKIGVSCQNGIYDFSIMKALAVDSAGDLYVSLAFECVSCGVRYPFDYPAASSGPLAECNDAGGTCTLVYGPNANGKVNPLTIINPGDYTMGFALDAANDLFMEQTTTDYGAPSVEVYTDALTNPTLKTTIAGKAIVGPTGLAIDAKKFLYVNDTVVKGSTPTNSHVEVFKDTVSGSGAAKRNIFTVPSQLWWPGIAVDTSYLYVGMGSKATKTPQTIETFAKTDHGQSTPLSSVAISGGPDIPVYIAVGP